jgi:hypothetical protein
LSEGIAFAFPPPAIPGVGTSGGFTFVLEDRAGKDVSFLSQNLQTFLAAARKRPELTGLISTFLPNVPQIFVDVDRDKVIKQGIDLSSVYQTLQTFMGGFFVNYFNRFGRTWQVYIEAEGEYRTDARNVGQFYVRNATGTPVPLDAISTLQIARDLSAKYPEITFTQADILNWSAAEPYDLVLCSLALHHFSENDAIRVLERCRSVTRRFVLVSDLRRGLLASLGVWFLTATIFHEPMTKYDGRLSASRAFSFSEMNELARRAGWQNFGHRRFPFARQAIWLEMT